MGENLGRTRENESRGFLRAAWKILDPPRRAAKIAIRGDQFLPESFPESAHRPVAECHS